MVPLDSPAPPAMRDARNWLTTELGELRLGETVLGVVVADVVVVGAVVVDELVLLAVLSESEDAPCE